MVADEPVAIQEDHPILDDREATETVSNVASSAQGGRKSYRVEKKLPCYVSMTSWVATR